MAGSGQGLLAIVGILQTAREPLGGEFKEVLEVHLAVARGVRFGWIGATRRYDPVIKPDKRLAPVLDIIKEKALNDGTWRMENSLNGKMWVDIEKKGKPSRWITYHALSVIKHFEGIKIIDSA